MFIAPRALSMNQLRRSYTFWRLSEQARDVFRSFGAAGSLSARVYKHLVLPGRQENRLTVYLAEIAETSHRSLR
jgi:hypothetical protein